MTRRVVLGRYNDGTTVGLRVSLPGYDALTDSSSTLGFSFDSEWTDIVKTKMIGLLSHTNFTIDLGFGGGISNPNGYVAYYTWTGYKCMLEARLIQPGGTIRDDYTGVAANAVGAPFLQSDPNPGMAFFTQGSSIGQFLIIIYDIGVPSG